MRSSRLTAGVAVGAGITLTATVTGCTSQPRTVAVVLPTPAGPQTEATCVKVLAGLPAELDAGVARLQTTPTSPLVGAWGSRSAPIIVRCGVGVPKTYDPAAELTAVNIDSTGEVGWYAEKRGSVSILTSVRRPVKVELTLPARYRPDVVLGSVTKVVAQLTPAGADTPD